MSSFFENMSFEEKKDRKFGKKKEDERVEFKRAASDLPDNLWETYSAFCNTDGGTIILGIREGKNKKAFKIAADGITRIDDTPVHKALREVLANALIHADYHGRRGILAQTASHHTTDGKAVAHGEHGPEHYLCFQFLPDRLHDDEGSSGPQDGYDDHISLYAVVL